MVTTVITAKTTTCKRLSRVVVAYLFNDNFSMWYMKKHLPVHTPVLSYFPSGQVSITQKSDCKYHSNLLFYCATQFISDISKIPLTWTPVRLWTRCINIGCTWNYRPTSCYASVFIIAQWRYLPSWHWYNSLRITYISDIVFLRKQSNLSHPRSQRVLYVVVIVYILLCIFCHGIYIEIRFTYTRVCI